MSAERTEPATPRHRAAARREGRVARSAQLTRAATWVAAALLIAATGASSARRIAAFTTASVERAFTLADPVAELWRAFDLIVELTLPFVVVVAGSAMLVGYAQVGPLFTPSSIVPDARRIAPTSPSRRAPWASLAVDTVRAMALLGACGFALLLAARDVLVVSRETLPSAVAATAEAIGRIAPPILAVVVFLAALDWLWVRHLYNRTLRMTVRERRQERRQTEADPAVRARLRRASPD